MDLVGWKPDPIKPSAESIAVEGELPPPGDSNVPPPVPPSPLPTDDDRAVPNAWFSQNFLKYSKEDSSGDDSETPMDIVSQYGNYDNLPPEGSYRHFWFTVLRDFRDSDEFWAELRDYYRVNAAELSNRLAPLSEESVGPVFSKRAHRDVGLIDLQTALAEKVAQRVADLNQERELIRQQLVDIGDSLLKQGFQLSDSSDYQELHRQNKAISDCIEQAHNTLNRYSEKAAELGQEAEKTLNKSVVDIHGSPELISKHYDQVTGRLIDLNLEIGEVRRKQQDLERELIKRLKDVEDAKDFRKKLEQLEREQILEHYREENRDSFERRDRREFYEELGALSENTSFIQRQIESQKKKLNYYMDNLKSLSPYENYETSVFEHLKRRKKSKEELRDLKNEVYKLKLFLARKERKYDEFFSGVNREVEELRGDVAKSVNDNSNLLTRCLDVWRDRWNMEGAPLMEETFDRTDKVVHAFAPIPALQIVKIGRLKDKLISEVKGRQREWRRVFEEIRKEFKDMGYELKVPVNSELDQKYFDRLDDANLTLSKDTQSLIFMPDAQFKLSNSSDERIGLEPKTQNDEDFLVIDQVWATLTPEQEKELEVKLIQDKADGVEEAREFLLNEQLRRIENRFPVKKETMESSSRELTEVEKREKYREIENHALRLWRGDNYLIANSRGEFKETLYEITKKLFSTKSVRVVDNKVEFTDTGFVRDGGTEILSAKDYFIKPEDRNAFEGSSDDLDLSEMASVHSEPDADMLELLSDPTYVSHAREREEKLAKLGAPLRPSVSEWAQIHMKKYHGEKGKIYDVETLRGKLLEMEDEIKALKEYHRTKGEQLDRALADRDASFGELKETIDQTKSFLEERKNSLREIMKDVDRAMDDRIKEAQEEFMKTNTSAPKGRKHGLLYWLNRLLYGSKDKGDDFLST